MERVQGLAARALAAGVPLGLDALESLTAVLPHLERSLWYILMEVFSH
jgi:hypothetical protein